MTGRLADKVAIITGAARGMGAAEAEAFVTEGAHVLLADVNDDEGKTLADRLGDGAEYLHHDVGEQADWTKLVEHVEATHGGVDILVNNAGIPRSGGIDDFSWDDFDVMVRVNQRGVLLGMQAVLASMRRRGGKHHQRRVRCGAAGLDRAARLLRHQVRGARNDSGRLADQGIGDHAAGTEVGVIAELGIFDRGVTKNFAATADGCLTQLDCRFDDCFGELWARWSRLVHVDWWSLIGRRPCAARRQLSCRVGGRACAFGLASMRGTRLRHANLRQEPVDLAGEVARLRG